MACVHFRNLQEMVDLLAEGVDRNCKKIMSLTTSVPSPSSRRAWIEINMTDLLHLPRRVALLAEGVDRNTSAEARLTDRKSRPPRGGRE